MSEFVDTEFLLHHRFSLLHTCNMSTSAQHLGDPRQMQCVQADFDGLHPVDGKINAQQAKQKMVEAPRVHIRSL